jgi:Anti-sigma-K factor rskA/Putative zinc-finger
MSDCPTHGSLVGGYALGALEPDEMEEMRRHVAVCPYCGPEADRLAALPGLLDRIVPADVPPPALPPHVEEAVLDRFARERREESAKRAASSRPRRGVRLGRSSGAASGPIALRRPLAVAASGVVALVVALALLLPGDEGGGSAYASVSLNPRAGASGSATAELGEVPAGTRIRLETRGLPAGSEYEVWCIRTDGRWVSGGTFWPDRDGRAEADLTAAVRPGDYHRMVVTRNPDQGGDRGPAVLGGPLKY